jgi:hypothetical protein
MEWITNDVEDRVISEFVISHVISGMLKTRSLELQRSCIVRARYNQALILGS